MPNEAASRKTTRQNCGRGIAEGGVVPFSRPYTHTPQPVNGVSLYPGKNCYTSAMLGSVIDPLFHLFTCARASEDKFILNLSEYPPILFVNRHCTCSEDIGASVRPSPSRWPRS